MIVCHLCFPIHEFGNSFCAHTVLLIVKLDNTLSSSVCVVSGLLCSSSNKWACGWALHCQSNEVLSVHQRTRQLLLFVIHEKGEIVSKLWIWNCWSHQQSVCYIGYWIGDTDDKSSRQLSNLACRSRSASSTKNESVINKLDWLGSVRYEWLAMFQIHDW